MNTTATDQEVDEFFDWLRDRLPPISTLRVPMPSPELLVLARQAVKAHSDYVVAHRPVSTKNESQAKKTSAYVETLLPLAAADRGRKDAPVSFESIGGDWSLSREDIPEDPDQQMLRFECREALIDEYKNRPVSITIGMETYDLGRVNRRGVAEAEIPSGLNFRQPINVSFGLEQE